jgi:5,10-methylenetetrahydromethanopterin reductase
MNDMVSNVQVAEKNGFKCVWITDQFFRRNIFSVLTACAMNTSNIKLATGVVHPLYRHPAVLASGIATIDEVSNGRAVMGVGAGAWTEVQPLCINLKKHFTICKESLEIITMLLSGKVADYDGEFFKLRKGEWWQKEMAFALGKPIPIFLGARGLKMFELAGRLAHGAVTWGLSQEYLKHVMGLMKKGAEKSDRKQKDSRLIVKTTYSFSNDQAAKNHLKYNTAMLTAGTADTLLGKLNLNPKTTRTIQEKWKKGNIEGAVESVDEKTINAWHLVASKEEMADRIEDIIKIGVTQIVVPPSGPEPKKFIERFGREVIPCF